MVWQLQEILNDLNDAQQVQQSCTKLLMFYVEDLLFMAQIDKGTSKKYRPVQFALSHLRGRLDSEEKADKRQENLS